MKTLLLVAVLATLAGCSNPGRDTCARARECCSTMSKCEEINREGPGWEERCDIGFNAALSSLATYELQACDKVGSALEELLSCLGGASCADVSSGDDGHVAKCDDESRTYCETLKASGDACGKDYSKLDCSNVRAELEIAL